MAKIVMGYDYETGTGSIDVDVLRNVYITDVNEFYVMDDDEMMKYGRSDLKKVSLVYEDGYCELRTMVDREDLVSLWQGVLLHRLKEYTYRLIEDGELEKDWKKRVKGWSMDRLDEEFEISYSIRER